jgi:hypothetical protein
MDTWDPSFFIALLAGALVSAVLLYFVIRVAVNHGIRDSKKPEWVRPPDSLPPR